MKRLLAFGLVVCVGAAALSSAGCRPKPKGISAVPAVTRPVPPGRTGPDLTSVTPGPGGRTDRETPVTTQQVPAPSNPPPENPSGVGLPTENIDGTGYVRDTNVFRAYTVYFDFDKSAVKPEERGKIETVANHFKGNATHRLKVEGHCDERGTEGYNLALGERRALAVREYLIRLGVGSDRIYTLSWGESRPAAEGHRESDWAKNRRGEFILLTPP
jgi:peptidoglycan-associated lipoprotein